MDSRETLSAIQVLRAIAALMVLAFHLAKELEASGTAFPNLYIGAAGVDLFFVISGFVMAHASAPHYGASGAGATFLARRLVRIVPLYWAVTSIAAVYLFLGHPDLLSADFSWAALMASFFFIPFPRPGGEWTPLLTVGWTLNYEMFFYILFAAALAFRRAIAITLVVTVIGVIAIVSAIAWPGVDTQAIWPVPMIAEFAFGMLIGAARMSGIRLSNASSVLLAIVGTAALLAIFMARIDSPRVLLCGIPMAAILAGAVLRRDDDLKGDMWDGLARLGDASYALYLVHALLLIPRPAAQRAFGMTDGPWNWWPTWYAASFVAASIVGAFLVHRHFEVPVTRFLKLKLKSWKSVV